MPPAGDLSRPFPSFFVWFGLVCLLLLFVVVVVVSCRSTEACAPRLGVYLQSVAVTHTHTHTVVLSGVFYPVPYICLRYSSAFLGSARNDSTRTRGRSVVGR